MTPFLYGIVVAVLMTVTFVAGWVLAESASAAQKTAAVTVAQITRRASKDILAAAERVNQIEAPISQLANAVAEHTEQLAILTKVSESIDTQQASIINLLVNSGLATTIPERKRQRQVGEPDEAAIPPPLEVTADLNRPLEAVVR